MNQQKQAINPNRIIADRRTIGGWFSDACRSPSVRGYLYLASAFVLLLFPGMLPVMLIILLPAFFSNRVPDVPLRLPMEANCIDRSDPKGGGETFNRARGAVYLGNERGSGKEAWVSWSDQRYHDYIMGATGSGKTETILAINANYILAGSGFLIGDGKGTMMFPKQTTTLARLGGADDDSFVISFLSGYKDQFGRTPIKRSNRMNPWGEGNASTVKELLTSMMSQGGGDNQIFQDGASSLADSLSPAWVEGRDNHLWDLNIDLIGQTLPLAAVFKLSQHDQLSPLTLNHIKNYLSNLGYDFNKPPSQQPENVTRMHGYYVNYFMRVVTSFAISYRHIYVCKQGEVNMRDTVRSRRCLTFTLPPLEKSPDEVQALGKILLVSARSASSAGLGASMEGKREETLDNLMGNRAVPYKYNFDEFSFYVLEGFSLMPAQLRGINISCLLGAQDFVGTQRAGEIDAESMLANARLKLFGALEDGGTWEKLRAILGEVDVAVYDRIMNVGSYASRYVPDMDLRLTRRTPIEIQDLQEQVEGQFHSLMRGSLRALKVYYPGIDDNSVLDDFELIRLVACPMPSEAQLVRLKQHNDFIQMLRQQETLFQPAGVLKNAFSTPASGCVTTDVFDCLNAFYKKDKLRAAAPLPSPESDTTENDLLESDTGISDATACENSEGADDTPDTLPVTHDTSSVSSVDQFLGDLDDDDFLSGLSDASGEASKPMPPSDHSHAEAAAQQYEQYSNHGYASSDDLLPATEEAAEFFYQQDGSQPSLEEVDGAYGMTDEETAKIEARYVALGTLLGQSTESAHSDAKSIVDTMRRTAFYLIPPKPQSEPNIEARVKTLFEQVEMFSQPID
ncbi:hypothetical protein [Marinobacterium stanieri]|uniref:Intracellular multiplication protein IcmO n=1 Tax=Marinobacterium stanieri TaxID=49186 RepID=A0A1N6X9Q2_9GAMM|nr:hypothetical protein [Marinobacterium stanieri]SIQ99075.1 hypothetical protein SAMN05421647_11336 [Marinobacterium stanieri]